MGLFPGHVTYLGFEGAEIPSSPLSLHRTAQMSCPPVCWEGGGREDAAEIRHTQPWALNSRELFQHRLDVHRLFPRPRNCDRGAVP